MNPSSQPLSADDLDEPASASGSQSKGSRPHLVPLPDSPEVPPVAHNTTVQGVKRVVDFTLAGAGLLMLLPVLVVIALLVKFSSPGPVFYRSLRIGQGYRPFYMLKFRTMRPDADAMREQLRQQARLEGELFKLANDPRVTPVGRFLRALSLDELPQLVNVLRGEMSLVGPRPLPPDESALFSDPYTVRFAVKPGITGLWQVSGRSSLGFQQLCELERGYVLSWSLKLDTEILARTLPAVLRSRGAY